jgi:hypothetical protein
MRFVSILLLAVIVLGSVCQPVSGRSRRWGQEAKIALDNGQLHHAKEVDGALHLHGWPVMRLAFRMAS